MAGILNVLLDLAFLPTSRRVTKLGLKDIMAGQRQESSIDLPLFAPANAINRCAHVIVDAAPRHAPKHPEPMHMGIKQHLVGLQRIGAQQKRPAM